MFFCRVHLQSSGNEDAQREGFRWRPKEARVRSYKDRDHWVRPNFTHNFPTHHLTQLGSVLVVNSVLS
jgi:hypothetical protein